jgi:hypothetical protein
MTKTRTLPAVQPTPVHQVIGLADLAAHFELTSRGILKMVDAGRFSEPLRVGRRLRWRVDVLNKWIEAGCPPLN